MGIGNAAALYYKNTKKKEDGKTTKPSTSSQTELPKDTTDMGTQTLKRQTKASMLTQTDSPPIFQGLVTVVEGNKEDGYPQ